MRRQNNIPATKPVKMKYMARPGRRAAQFGVPFSGIPPYPIDPDEDGESHGNACAAGGLVQRVHAGRLSHLVFRSRILAPGEPAQHPELSAGCR